MRLLGVFIASAATLTCAAPTRQFDWFFPGWNEYIQEILADSCGAELAAYRTGNINTTIALSSLATPVVDCILDEYPEFLKTELSASAVVLGSLPIILQSLGSTTAETALIGLRRPGLAFLLAAGSPTVAANTAGEFVETLSKFVVTDGEDVAASFNLPGVDWSVVPPLMQLLISFAEYLIVGGAVANVIHMAYRLGVHAIVGFTPDTIFMVPLWTLLAVLIHLAGVLGLALRVKAMEAKSGGDDNNNNDNNNNSNNNNSNNNNSNNNNNNTWRLPSELIPSAAVIHTILGTLVLSILLFFSVTDSVIIVARYMASAVVCRAVARLELSGLRAATKRTCSTEGGTGAGRRGHAGFVLEVEGDHLRRRLHD
ncbi:uncharacterized protein J7T54_007554 [Emericellopsis cladophorae]|uniref:Uncharacterized protein n=1 Tax=Emericellopsis cladophorae TaxID=2686198 RepID=A0A9P9XXD6_9HYPO|nr:uncharacterized protein J7T54_007554 [Emericellopsis cladophorae]KAI6779099.1 hypothetical protein J7T54_007554 [Emericellopsis cladophorae]